MNLPVVVSFARALSLELVDTGISEVVSSGALVDTDISEVASSGSTVIRMTLQQVTLNSNCFLIAVNSID